MNEIGSRLDPKGGSGSSRRRICGLLLLILALSFCLRVFLILYPEVIHNDGTAYVHHARLISSGDWSGKKSPPLYPFLTASFRTLTGDFELAGIWVSVVLGALIVLPVFYLARTIFDEKVGFLSALLAAVHPVLYISSGSVLTESTYHFFLATSVLFGWVAFRGGRVANILLFAFFTTLTYLTRPEAIGFLMVFSAWVLWFNPPGERRRLVKRVGMIVIAVVGFLVFSSPYLIQIRKETGRWGISKKASFSIGSLSEEEGAPSIDTIKKKGLTLSSLVKNPLPVLGKASVGFFESLYKFQQVYNPILFLLALFGLAVVFKRGSPNSKKGSLYLIAYFIFFFGLVLPFFWVTRRYTSQLISIAIPWAACGCLEGMEWADRRWSRREGRKGRRIGLSAVLFSLLLIVLFIQGRPMHPREHRLIQREAGLWMKDHLPRGAVVMGRFPQEAFYAELPWARMPLESYEEILQKARARGVRYVIIDESFEKDSPEFWQKSKGEDLIRLEEWKRKGRRIILFQLTNSGTK